jgi:hypothetical protein
MRSPYINMLDDMYVFGRFSLHTPRAVMCPRCLLLALLHDRDETIDNA